MAWFGVASEDRAADIHISGFGFPLLLTAGAHKMEISFQNPRKYLVTKLYIHLAAILRILEAFW